MSIRLLVPSMPSPMQCMPFWNRMHAARQYVNSGPLVLELQDRIHDRLGIPCVALSNGTLAIELALRALCLSPGDKVLVPAVTFPATGLAIRNAGLVPVVADVDPDGQLTPEIARQHQRVDAVVPVATFGLPVVASRWFAFAEAQNIPVVVDAAGALMDQPVCSSRLVHFAFSLHATKFIGCGEGGLVASSNRWLIDRVSDMATFGAGGTNAKMSEVHAAVALASLLSADERRQRTAAIMAMYRGLLPAHVRIHGDPTVVHRTLLPVLMPSAAARTRLADSLAAHGIESKQWYRPFLDERTDLAIASPMQLPMTQHYRDHCLGLPFHLGLSFDDITAVCTHVADAMGG